MKPLGFEWLALAQINATVGDITGNMMHIRAARAEARALGAEMLACPELSICGYPPEDLMLRPSFRHACMEAVRQLASETAEKGPALLVGSPWEEDGRVYNAALLLDDGGIAHIHRKVHLPNYGVFDERRIFDAGPAPEVAHWRRRALGIMVCEDVWYTDAPSILAAKGAQALVVINASPFEVGKMAQRQARCAKAARAAKLPIAYVNLAGGQDDIVFDGGAFAMNAAGEVTMQSTRFAESVVAAAPVARVPELTPEEETWQALCTGLGDYVRKNGFTGVLLGLSGGIDSSLTAALAVEALGREAVLGVLLPSEFTSRESVEDALALSANLGIETANVSIQACRRAAHEALSATLPEARRMTLPVDGNIQARLRGLMLMALSNATGRMLLATSNKSEVATGYTTLYGDSCGGYAPLKDVYKTQLYRLAHWRNESNPLIPERSIAKAPTAELAPHQKDEDQLPPYPVLDAVLERIIEQSLSVDDIEEEGYERAMVERIMQMVRTAEYKRRQLPPGVKVSSMTFGRDWRYPLTNGFKG